MSLLSLSKKILNREGRSAGTKKSLGKASADKQGKTAQKKTKGAAEKKAKPKTSKKAAAVPVSIMAARVGLFPILSEKSVGAQERNTIVFRVIPSSTKQQIALAVKEKYGVRVTNIRTANFVPKQRRRGVTVGRTNYWKKAYVTVDDISPIMQ